jgi:acetone carboxylase gamma subunit
MSYSGMRFVDKLHADYNPCLTPVWGSLTSYTQTTIHVLLWYEVRWQVTHRLQSMSYSCMRFVDKLQTDYNSCLTPVWGLLTSYTQTSNPCLTLVWGSLTGYTQTTFHVLLRYEVRWQITHRLQSMSYSIMRFVDKLHTYYNPCLTLVWGLLTSYTQTTIHVLLWYEVCWQVTPRLQSMSYSIMRFIDKLHRVRHGL